MRTTKVVQSIGLLMLSAMVSSRAGADENNELLNRSIYMPVEFQLCEHLGSAIFYENDAPTSAMPAQRIYQFTYYPNLGAMLPEQVPVRVEGTYKEDGEPFVAKLAVTVDGVHSANRLRSTNTEEQVARRLHNIDIRLKPTALKLSCKRFCKRAKSAHTEP